MKKISLLSFSLLASVALVSCGKTSNLTPSKYNEKAVHIYRKPNVIDKDLKVRFYEDQPNVPYIEVNKYFKEFFNSQFQVSYSNGVYRYINDYNAYLGFDFNNWTFSSNYLDSFNHHPDFAMANGKNFIKTLSSKTYGLSERFVSLGEYNIPFYEEAHRVYVPLTFLSKFAGGSSLYNVAYNGKDIYVIDRGGQLGDPVDYSSYNDYYALFNDVNTPRPQDLATYSYNELCFVWDNMRGLTSQLVLGDNNLLSIGLNGTIEKYAPKLKEYLLSTDKTKYYQGYYTLFNALYDGGHTSPLASFNEYTMQIKNDAKDIPEFSQYIDAASYKSALKTPNLLSYVQSKAAHFDYAYNTGPHNYYSYDETSKTSYIGFDEFEFDFNGWDAYYNNQGEVPVNSDTFAYIRSKLYQAKSDGADNLVLDLTTNGGGSVATLVGLVGLFNGAKSYYSMNEIFNHSRGCDEFMIDVNLDGEFDDADIQEANMFNFHVGVLTSEYSFSCGNLFPSVMKELGFKILGVQSGGGSCAISYESTADGLPYVRSSMSYLANNNGDNVDSGVEVDLEIEKLPHATLPEPMFKADNFYDPSITGTYLSTAYSE